MILQPKPGWVLVAVGVLIVTGPMHGYCEELITKEVLLGPVDLPAHSHPPHNGGFAPVGLSGQAAPWFFTSQLPLVDLHFDADMSLVEFRPEVVDNHGKPLPGSLLCHTAVVTMDQSSAENPQMPKAMVGSGGELSEVVLPLAHGITLSQHKHFQLMSMFRNPTAVNYHQVYLKVHMRLKPLVSQTASSFSDTEVVWVSVTDGDGVYMVPPGKDVRTKRFTFPWAGTVVFIMGHQHAPFGDSFVLENLTTRTTVWRAQAEKTFGGQAIRFPRWSAEQAFHVVPGHEYQLTVTYNNTSTEAVDAMGVVGIFVVPDVEPIDRSAIIRKTLDRGLEALAQQQRPTGMFPLCWDATAAGCDYEKTSLAAAFVAEALASLADARAKSMVERARTFVSEQQEPGGVWRFWTAADPRYREAGPDLDDTACAAAIVRQGLPTDHVEMLQRFQTAEGVFVTWMDPVALGAKHREYVHQLLQQRGQRAAEDNDIDCAVNANVLWYAATRGKSLQGVCDAMTQAVIHNDIPRCSLYYVSAQHIYYMLARAYTAGASCLASATEPMQQAILTRQKADGSWGDDLETACAVAALLRIGYRGQAVARGVDSLVAHQRADGSWPSCRFIASAHGSSSLTTAIAIEAIARYLQAVDRSIG